MANVRIKCITLSGTVKSHQHITHVGSGLTAHILDGTSGFNGLQNGDDRVFSDSSGAVQVGDKVHDFGKSCVHREMMTAASLFITSCKLWHRWYKLIKG